MFGIHVHKSSKISRHVQRAFKQPNGIVSGPATKERCGVSDVQSLGQTPAVMPMAPKEGYIGLKRPSALIQQNNTGP